MTQPHEHYYVPAQSKWPIIATLGMGTSVYGLATWFNDMSAQRADSNGPLIFSIGGLFLAYMLFGWFGAVIKESRAGLYSAQMDRSFRWGMSWFIFSEVMFFAAFFGALFYVRTFAGPWLGGEGAKGVANMLWPNFEYVWPLLQNPDSGLFPPPREVIDPGMCRCSTPCCWRSASGRSCWRAPCTNGNSGCRPVATITAS